MKARCRESLSEVPTLKRSPGQSLNLRVLMEAILGRLINGMGDNVEKMLAVKGLD
jgi:hypothetical protein